MQVDLSEWKAEGTGVKCITMSVYMPAILTVQSQTNQHIKFVSMNFHLAVKIAYYCFVLPSHIYISISNYV